MKFRGIFFALLALSLVGGFWFLTTHLPEHLFARAHTGSPLELTEAEAAPSYDAEEQNNIAVYKKALPSVVNITSTTLVYNFFYGAVPQQGQGSGFILDKAGHVLTNFHVIAGANRGIEVKLSDKHTYKAQVVGTDKTHDLALLKIDAPDLTPATLASSSDLVVGQKVYAIGNPFGLSGTMTRGIISSIRSIRTDNEEAPIENAIQTDAAINPGNSGGPLLNSRGEVIGINTMIASNGADQSSGIGFAIPINTAKAVLDDLTKFGKVRRPVLGISGFPVDPDLAAQMGLLPESGVLVEKVIPGGAAESAGIRGGNEKAYLGNTEVRIGGDLIVAIDGEEITNSQDVNAIMDKHKAGDMVSVTIIRGKKKFTIKLRLGDSLADN